MEDGPGEPGEPASLEPLQSPRCSKAKRQKIVDRIIPFVVLGINGYILYGFSYEVVWKWVHPKGVRIAVYTILGVLNLMMLVSWAAVQLWGPSVVDEKYKRIDSPHEPFVCDEDGYTLWCSQCQHFKPARARHSSAEGVCVPVMDHYCIWLGRVIGQGNLKFFLQFVVYSWFTMILILVVQFRYQHRLLPHIAAQAIPIYVLCGFWFLFLTMLLIQHVYFLLTCQSTLEHMDRNKSRYPYFNIPFKDGRQVIKATKSDMVPGPYSLGIGRNITRVMGPWYTWLLPIREPIEEPEFNRRLLAKLQARHEAFMEKELASSTPPAPASPSSTHAVTQFTPDSKNTPLHLPVLDDEPSTTSFATAENSLTRESEFESAPSAFESVFESAPSTFERDPASHDITPVASNASLSTIVPNN